MKEKLIQCVALPRQVPRYQVPYLSHEACKEVVFEPIPIYIYELSRDLKIIEMVHKVYVSI